MNFKKIISLLICLVMLTSLTVSGAGVKIYNPLDTADGEAVSEFYDDFLGYVQRYYKYDVTREQLMEAAVDYMLTNHPELLAEFGKGAFEALDENCYYYTAEEFESAISDVEGTFVGIGINVYQDEDKVILGEAIPGAPAENAGFEVGDIVVAVDGQRVEGFSLDKVTELIRGIEGTEVAVTVLRNGVEYTYSVLRAVIKINPVEYEYKEGSDVGYVKISSFNANTIEAIDNAMNDLGSKGVKKIVLDLRNNLGGYLQAAVAVASYFIPDKDLVVTEEYKKETQHRRYYAKETKYKFKGVVLINEYSASASELVSAAIRDYNAGILVGQTSYGKGTVQTYEILRNGDYIWYTVAEYYTPSHKPIHKVGVDPDHFVTNKYKPFDMSTVTPYEITRVLSVGCTGQDVYALKERLSAIGFLLEVNDVYDQKTADAVTSLQKSTELFPYGVADITTQIKLNDVLKETKVQTDNQLEKAMELAENMK